MAIQLLKINNLLTLLFITVSCLQVSVLVNVIVEKNGQVLGQRSVKCESRMRELDQLIRSLDNPLNFLCQVRIIIFIQKYNMIGSERNK